MAAAPRAPTPCTWHQPAFCAYQVAGMGGFCHLCQLALYIWLIICNINALSFSCSLKSFIAFAFPLSVFFLFAMCKTINELQAEIWDSACNKLMHPFECMKWARSSLRVSLYCALECQPVHSPPKLPACALGDPLTLIHREAPCPSLRSACIRSCTGLLIGPDAHI